jgi:hypothetical protein
MAAHRNARSLFFSLFKRTHFVLAVGRPKDAIEVALPLPFLQQALFFDPLEVR